MSNEITVQVGVTIQKRSGDNQRLLIDHGYNRQFRMDMTGQKGPCPGAIQVPLTGVDVDLSAITTPGIAWFHHEGLSSGADVGSNPSIYYVDVGVKDLISGRWLPVFELWPGEAWPLRLSRNLLESYNATGTGTGSPVNKLRMQAYILSANVFAGVYER